RPEHAEAFPDGARSRLPICAVVPISQSSILHNGRLSATPSRRWIEDNIGMMTEGEHDSEVSARSVLIVDDSENAAATLEIALLAIPGLSVTLASSGLEALRIL